jgi:hypothetical protein
MATNVNIFETRILIKSEKPIRYHPFKDMEYEYKKTIKTYHIELRTKEQAIKIAQKLGDVLSCRKIDRWSLAGNI